MRCAVARTAIDTEGAQDARAGVGVPDDSSGADRRLGTSYGTILVVEALDVRAGNSGTRDGWMLLAFGGGEGTNTTT